MKLVVGLGNPGPQYRETRHNVGFLVIDELASRWHVESWREAFKALTAKVPSSEPVHLRHVGSLSDPTKQHSLAVRDANRSGGQVMLAKPLTFMNLSGQAVAGVAGFYKIDPADLLIVADDVALPLGRLRARRGGSDGGHNGFKSVSEALGTQEFPRLRIGVGRGDDRRDLADHVLGRFQPDEREAVEAAVLRAADAVETFVVDGIERVMNAFNAAADSQQDPGSA